MTARIETLNPETPSKPIDHQKALGKLSIIIVNYNVKYFLEHALYAVRKAVQRIDSEIFVVDNDSKDGSLEMLAEKFPDVICIANKKNVGFSTANNQAIRKSTGDFVLLLNPDTVVEEDTFEKCLHFMNLHPEAGALGVKMVDGTGRFLPESKRALPTPMVSFYKIFGLSSLFPKSRIFAKYHLGYLDNDETHEVEVLAGAYMMVRKKTLDEVGLLDETFFMYGEDIDLSYRIIKGGYKNYYFPETRIIHYKGESTKKGSLNYVRMFYRAMIIFARKHYSSGLASLYAVFIYFAIFLKAGLSLISNLFKSTYLLLLDAALSFGGIYFIKEFWATNIKDAPEYYPPEFMNLLVPLYIFIWVTSTYFGGGYDRPVRMSKIFRGLIFGTLIIAAIYGFLPDDLRFSRAIILMGAAWTGLAMVLTRLLYNLVINGKLGFDEVEQRKVAIVGNEEESKRALTLIKQSGIDANVLGFVATAGDTPSKSEYLGRAEELQDIVDVYQLEEIIFCAKDINANGIIRWMTDLGPKLDYKIIPEKGFSIIGSSSKNTAGDLYAIDINLTIDTSMARRNKRVFDLSICLSSLILFPLTFFLIKKPLSFWQNWTRVLLGKRTWVGYDESGTTAGVNLPKIKKGILSPVDIIQDKVLTSETISRLNLFYAKDYAVEKDMKIIMKSIKHLGKS